MRQTRLSLRGSALLALSFLLLSFSGCATAPKEKDREAFLSDSRTATQWFESRVPGLRQQIASSAGYIVYPSVTQWGFLWSGGKFGRGMVARPDGAQIGWASIKTANLGPQAGVQGFRMLVLFENEATLQKFMKNQLTGSAGGVAVVAETGMSGTSSFENGVAIYQGASKGLMAGATVALDYMKFEGAGDETWQPEQKPEQASLDPHVEY